MKSILIRGIAVTALFSATIALGACSSGYDRGYNRGYTSVHVGVTDHHAYRGDYRDRDHDGVPNRFDRDRDGDGVPNRVDDAPNNPRIR